MKTQRVPVPLSPEQKAEIRRRASSHGLSMAEFMRRSALGTFGAPGDDPDVWWDTKTAKRKKQIMRWESKRKGAPKIDGPTLPFAED